MIYRTVDYKTVTNHQLSVTAKCILFLLYCFMGDSCTAFPSRVKILECLALSKTGYYKHYRQLEQNGMISVNRKKYRNNTYLMQWEKQSGRGKYGIVYKDIMVNPAISPTAKLLYVYITAFCPYNRSWEFKKSTITKDLCISPYLLSKGLAELEYFKLITVTYEQYKIIISNQYQSDSPKKKGHSTSKKQDTSLKKEGHEASKKKDREENINKETSIISQSKSDGQETTGEDELPEPATDSIRSIQISDCKKIYVDYLQALLIQQIKNGYASALKSIFEKHQISMEIFCTQFIKRFTYKTKHTVIRSTFCYMRVCLIEFIDHYDSLIHEQPFSKPSGFGAAYDLSEYENSSVFDDLSEEELSELGITDVSLIKAPSSPHLQESYPPTYDLEEYESTSVLDEEDYALENVMAGAFQM